MINTKTKVVHVYEFYCYANIYKPGFSGNSTRTPPVQTKNKMENHGRAQCLTMTSYFGIDTLIGLQVDFRNSFKKSEQIKDKVS